jgi:hypothetical protein
MEENANIAVSNLHWWKTQGGNKIRGFSMGNFKE